MSKLRQECTLAAELLRGSLKRMEELMEIAKMDESPEHVDTMLYYEADIATHACDKLKELKEQYEAAKMACPATMTQIENAMAEYEEVKDNYQEHKSTNGGNPH